MAQDRRKMRCVCHKFPLDGVESSFVCLEYVGRQFVFRVELRYEKELLLC
jgi:hypothetical protein